MLARRRRAVTADTRTASRGIAVRPRGHRLRGAQGLMRPARPDTTWAIKPIECPRSSYLRLPKFLASVAPRRIAVSGHCDHQISREYHIGPTRRNGSYPDVRDVVDARRNMPKNNRRIVKASIQPCDVCAPKPASNTRSSPPNAGSNGSSRGACSQQHHRSGGDLDGAVDRHRTVVLWCASVEGSVDYRHP